MSGALTANQAISANYTVQHIQNMKQDEYNSEPHL